MTLEEFERLQTIAEKDTEMPDKLDLVKIKNGLLPALIQKWTKLYSKQKFIVSTLKVEQYELYTKIFNAYKFPDKKTNPYNLDLNHFWGDKPKEIELQINAVPIYVAKCKEVNTQEYFLDYIEKTLANVKDLRFTIKNFIDINQTLTTNF